MHSKKRKDVFLLVFLVLLLIAINYSFLDKQIENFFEEYETGVVERVIDGDTVVVNKTSVRLLGINSPEKGEIYYTEAKEFLEELVLEKEVKLKFGKEKKDRYNRELRYLFVEEENINKKLVEKGLANFYFPERNDFFYYIEFRKAWKECLEKGESLCEKSLDICAECIELQEFNYKDQEVALQNICGFSCDLKDWTIKDEGRKKFVFPEFLLDSGGIVIINVGEGVDSRDILYWKGEDYVWTESGDSLFLRDAQGKLVLWRSY